MESCEAAINGCRPFSCLTHLYACSIIFGHFIVGIALVIQKQEAKEIDLKSRFQAYKKRTTVAPPQETTPRFRSSWRFRRPGHLWQASALGGEVQPALQPLHIAVAGAGAHHVEQLGTVDGVVGQAQIHQQRTAGATTVGAEQGLLRHKIFSSSQGLFGFTAEMMK
jgi:hypothetical protein